MTMDWACDEEDRNKSSKGDYENNG